MRITFWALITSAVILFGGQSAFAGLVAVDDFESYTAGNGLNNGSAGNGWDANWDTGSTAVVTEHTINYPMAIDGVSYSGGSNAVLCNGPSGVDDSLVEREFPTQSGTVYFSVLAERHYDGVASELLMQFQISNNTPANNNNLGGAAMYSDKIDARLHYPNPGPTVAGSSYPYDSSDIAFIVVKLSKSGTYGSNYDTVEMFVNPTSSIEPATADADTSGNFDMGSDSVSYFALRSAYLSSTNYAYFDDIRVGTDFASVLPTAVPEPSTFAMLLALGLALPMILRRKMK